MAGARCPTCDVYLTVRAGKRCCAECGEVYMRPSEAVQWLMDNLGAIDVTPPDPNVRNGRVPALDGQLGLEL